MIDGINICIIILEWLALHLIYRFDLVYTHTPYSTEKNFKYIGTVRSLFFEIRYKDGQYILTCRGSLHKFYHQGNNDGDFFFNELHEVIGDVYSLFNIKAASISSEWQIKQEKQIPLLVNKVEVGVNLTVGIDHIADFLRVNLIQHKKKSFELKNDLVHVCEHKNYYLKVYPKGENLLRVEIVFLTNELRKFKVKNLSDLTPGTIKLMTDRLKKEFSQIIWGDGIEIHKENHLTKRELLLLLKFTNTWRNNKYTEDLRKADPRQRKNMKQRMWWLGVENKKIFDAKGAGYKKELVSLLDKKLDSFYN
jgi:hypothetical protein